MCCHQLCHHCMTCLPHVKHNYFLQKIWMIDGSDELWNPSNKEILTFLRKEDWLYISLSSRLRLTLLIFSKSKETTQQSLQMHSQQTQMKGLILFPASMTEISIALRYIHTLVCFQVEQLKSPETLNPQSSKPRNLRWHDNTDLYKDKDELFWLGLEQIVGFVSIVACREI